MKKDVKPHDPKTHHASAPPGLCREALDHLGTLNRTGFIDDAVAYVHVFLDTPLWPADRERRTAKTLGINLMTRARGSDNFPDRFGKLAHHEESSDNGAGLVVVLCKPSIPTDTRKTIWIGNPYEYATTWEVD